MYDLPYYKDQSPERIREFIDHHPFAFLSGCDAQNQPVATQVPVFIEEQEGRKFLRGHIMRNTDHHNAFLHNPNVLVVFTGHHTYVSATWYSNPRIPSTWNYMSVHARGRIRFLDEQGLMEVLQKTSLHFEKGNTASSTVFENMPLEAMQRLMKAIVAFEIEITAMDHVFKLSQDRDAESYETIKARLSAQGEAGQAIAAEMEKRTKDVFPDKA